MIAAVISVWNREEIMELLVLRELPPVGGLLALEGDFAGSWRISGVKPEVTGEYHDAIIFVDSVETPSRK